MGRLKKILIGLILLGQGCSADEKFEEVLKSPDKFHDQEVEVVGVFHARFEDYAIYVTRYSDRDKAIWINFSKAFMSRNTFIGLDGQKIRLTGIFNKNDKGHLSQYAGSLDEAEAKMEIE